MSGQIMRSNNRLHELAPPEGYLTVHPTAPTGTWDLQTDPAIIGEFMDDVIAAFHVDENRVHVTGFSMGSATTFWFLCNRPELLAQERCGNIDSDVLQRTQYLEEPLGLGAIAGAEVDQRRARSNGCRDLRRALRKDRLLVARKRILGQFADCLEEPRPQRVVEELR